MRIVQLKVENFGCVTAAKVELGRGLNVLFGPNELGKSSLVAAIRSVLLLPQGSSTQERWRNWQRDLPPKVELVLQTDSQFWRIRKTYETQGGSAELEESKDGVQFVNVAKGRQTDGELRKILNWGIPEPGGGGRTKGLPESYLATVLLPYQESVTSVFDVELSLDKDQSNSGKERLLTCLHAIATDPIFARVLEQTQVRVDEVFTTKGQRKSAKSSPLVQLSGEIVKTKETLAQASEQLNKSAEAKARIQSLHAKRTQLQDQLREARERLKQRRQLFDTRTAIEARRKIEQDHLQVAEATDRELSQLANELNQKQLAAQQLAGKLVEAGRAVESAEQQFNQAREQLQRASGHDAATQRQLKQQAIEKQILEIDAELRQLDDLLRRLVEANELAATARQSDDALAAIQRDAARLKGQDADAERLESSARAEIRTLDGVTAWRQWREACDALKRTEGEIEQAALNLANATRFEAHANELEARAKGVPTVEQLTALRTLDREYQTAAAKLAVGLAVSVRPLKAFTLQVETDGGIEQTHELSKGSLDLIAEREMTLTIANLAKIEISGGSAELRTQTARLKERWDKEVAPALKLAGVTSFDELERRCADAAQLLQDATNRRHDAATLRAAAPVTGDAPERCAELRRVAADCDAALAAHDRAAIESRATSEILSARDLAQRRQKADAQLNNAIQARSSLQSQIAANAAKLELAEPERDRLRQQFQNQRQELPADLGTAAAVARDTRTSLLSKRAECERQLTALGTEKDSDRVRANAAVQQAELRRQEAIRLRDDLDALHRQATTSAATSEGALRSKREAAAKTDLAACRSAVQSIDLEIAALPAEARSCTEQSLGDEAAAINRTDEELRKIESSLDQEDGAYRASGGDTVRDRVDSLSNALEKKRQREQELEAEYEAWQLLLTTLRQVENEQSSHLGRAVMPDLTRRFQELTTQIGRQVELGPNLDKIAISAEGQPRDIDQISLGTREQLSTLVRLTLAERLGSFLVLDDQLIQSDAPRMNWFRERLAEASQHIQIIVITCRPTDYTDADRLPSPPQPFAVWNGGFLRAIDLEQTMQQSADRPNASS